MTLGDILEQVKRPRTVAELTEIPFAGVRWHGQGVYHRATQSASEVKTKTVHEIEANDVVYNRMWATKGSFGVVKQDVVGCVVTNDFPIFTAVAGRVLPSFVELILSYEPFLAAAASSSTGSTGRRRLNERDFRKIPIDLPPLAEQQRIVDLIGSLDEAIEAAEVETNSARAAAQAVLSDRLGQSWQRVLVGDVAEKRTDFSKVDMETSYDIAGVQRSGLGLALRGKTRGDSMKFRKLMCLEAGNLVYRTITAFEAPSTVVLPKDAGNYVTPQAFPVFRLDAKRILSEYMALLTTDSSFHQAMAERCTGSVLRRKTLSVESFRSIPIALPPLGEQQGIVDLIGTLSSAADAAGVYLGSLRKLRSELLTALLSGAHTIPESYDQSVLEIAA